ncbi:hypothetical protein N665_0016s0044 [Sinapis alba]|nr:hypothetical protein N665_0016s0044 [Sinapis alba]
MTSITLPPEHALSIFLTNMNQHLALHVRQFNVTTVPAAARIAKLHELSLHHTPTKPSRSPFNPYQKQKSSPFKSQQSTNTPATPNTRPLLPTNQKRLTFEEMQERKLKGLCMFCKKPFTPGHQLKHKRAQILYLETEHEDLSGDKEDKDISPDTTLEDQDNKVPTISVHALNGSPTYNCMRIMGQYGKRKLHILIDPGSTHNFLDIQIAKFLGCNLKSIKPMYVPHLGHYKYLVMPFGLTNTPCTFQGLMNHVFEPVLRKFLLIKYLGHFISYNGVSTDPSKIKAVQQWPTPTNQRQLRSFLGLANYYRRFIQGHNIIARPLTMLLQKDMFLWISEVSFAFQTLKEALIYASVLALPDFSKQFIIETEAFKTGIGAVLMQDNHPICFINRALGPRNQNLFVYEKELLAVVHAVQTWNLYLAHNKFVIRTDQKSLKLLLEQKITKPF